MIDSLSTKQWKCPECSHLGKYYAEDSRAIACEKCKHVFIKTGIQYVKTWKNNKANISAKQIIPIGSQVNLEEIGHGTVLGFLIREETKYNSCWTEYYIKNTKGENFYLTEFQGHWHLISENKSLTEASKKTAKKKIKEIEYNSNRYKLFNFYFFKNISLDGELPFVPTNDKENYVREFICPPYFISEELDKSNVALSMSFHGRYVYVSELKAGIKSSSEINWPFSKGIGFAQPNPYLAHLEIEFLQIVGFIAFLFILNLGFNKFYRADKKVFSTTIHLTDSTSRQTIVTDHFVLEGHTSEVEVEAIQFVDNSWTYLNVSLVDAKTYEERNFELELDFYKGYSEGESWNEGSNQVSKNINSIPPGEYYLVISTDVDTFGIKQRDITVNVHWQPQKSWNFLWAVILIVLFAILLYYLSNHSEYTRWKNGYTNPYESD